jgi:hypothetical protein
LDQQVSTTSRSLFLQLLLFWAMLQVLMKVVVDPWVQWGSNNNFKHLSNGKQQQRLTLEKKG